MSRRSTASGETRRTATSGSSEKTAATQTPTPMPESTAGQDSDQAHVHGQHAAQQAGQRELERRRRAKRPAGCRRGRPGPPGPGTPRARCRRGAQAAQHGDRGHAPLDEDVDGARDAEPPEQQRHERDEAQEVAEARERLAEPPLVLRDGAHGQALGRQRRAEALGELVGVRAVGKAQVRLVARARAARQEAGLLDARARDVDARSEGAAHPDVAWRAHDVAAHHEARLADRDLVARRRRRAWSAARARRSRRRSRRAAPTRRPAPSRSSRRTGSRGRPRAPARAARRPAAGGTTIAPKLVDAGEPGRRAASAVATRPSSDSAALARRDRPQPSSGPRRAGSAPRAATDARRLSVKELIATSAATPIAIAATISSPRRLEPRASRQASEKTKRGLQATTAPSRSRSTRCARAASSGSWVTSTTVVPSSRFSSASSSTTLWPFAASRFPVGSSANSSFGPVHEGARQRHALLLAARQLRRVVVRRGRRARRARSSASAALARRPRRAARAAPRRSRAPSASGSGGTTGTRSRRSRRAARALVLAEAETGRGRRAARGRSSGGRAPRAGRAACSCRCPRAR